MDNVEDIEEPIHKLLHIYLCLSPGADVPALLGGLGRGGGKQEKAN